MTDTRPHRERTLERPAYGVMWIGVLADGLVKPVPQEAPRGLAVMEQGFIRDRGEGSRIVAVAKQEFPELHHVYYRGGQFEFVPVVQPPRQLAPLNVDDVLELIGHFSGHDEIPEPPPAPVEEGESDGIPDAFRGLMLPDESPEKFTERMRRRWANLQQYRIDGSKPTHARALPDMTPEEVEELADLERRNSQHKWLD